MTVRSVLELLNEPANLPAIVHCSAGKDRIGVVIAILLSALGVSYDQVERDYLLSNDYLEEWTEKRLSGAVDPDRYREYLKVHRTYLHGAYERLGLLYAQESSEISACIGIGMHCLSDLRNELLE